MSAVVCNGPQGAAGDFERCAEPGYRLAIWYNGMLEACRHADKIVKELAG